ncbi:TolB family protein [Aquibacillus salsiterrae]|uniref:TolB domain-containing protein n=1 Tax=Aquibacillus salsiterrae TaxID=2950439 RepID=A0A9X3WJB5_9BACI|nr:hypothetical protein [Aquibacillus salsiterrae]MDC3418111.1 hypothetical protein [Aquibacillus salsiterrae]
MKLFMTLVIMLVLLPTTVEAANSKAGFIRSGNVWIYMDGEETQITDSGKVFETLKWSHDGKWLLYQEQTTDVHHSSQEQNELWAYEVETGERKKVFYDGYSPKWSPNKPIIAYQDKGILDISDLNQFYNIASGVDSYSWLPDGSGFLLSSAGNLKPDGWSSATLYTKKLNDNYGDTNLFGGVKELFTLPKEVGFDGKSILAVNASHFSYSPTNKWISFIVSPTASWSMDSNMLCVLSKDGKKFEVLDEVIFGVGEPKWAPSRDIIAYIAGGGRIVFGFKNKDLKLQEMPVSNTYTPPNFMELDFDWISNNAIVTSRVEEKEWSNDIRKQPLPALYAIEVKKSKQTQITHPPKGYGDYSPQYVKSIDKLIWYRGTSLTDPEKKLWIANTDGSNAKEWMKDVDSIEFYSGK